MADFQSRGRLPDEFTLIARYFAPLAHGFPGAADLKDDAAVIVAAPQNELVVKTDAIVADIDFMASAPPQHVARKALRVNLSDLAAKGAVPSAYLLTLLLPPWVQESWVSGFAEGLRDDQALFGVHLIGGDTGSTSGPLAVSVCAFGEVPRGRIIRRAGARPGDRIFVTGTIGDAALGLEVMMGRIADLDQDSAQALRQRYQLPQPRTTLGPELLGLAHSSTDISDGLVQDLRHLCESSQVCAEIELGAIPLSAAARRVLQADPPRQSLILAGGDDYEILFTSPADASGAVSDLSRRCGIPITAIGQIKSRNQQGSTVQVRNADGSLLKLEYEGWQHFGPRSAHQ